MKKIAVLEDSETIIRMLEIALKELLLESDAELEILRQPSLLLRHPSGEYDVVIGNADLPFHSGLGPISEFKSKATNRGRPALLMALRVTEEFRWICRRFGIDAIVEKPFDDGNLAKKVAYFLNKDE